jgi:hypothetical protein
MRERFECGVEVSRTASESFRGRCAQGVLDKSDDFKTATAQRSLDRFAVELTLFRMRSRVRAAYPCGVGKTPSDDGRRGWFETVTSHLVHQRSNGLAGYPSGRLAAASPRLFTCGAALSELLVVRVHGLSNPRVGQVDLVAEYDLRRLGRPHENDHDGPPRMHLEPETSGMWWQRHRLDDAWITRCGPLPVHGAHLRGQHVFPPPQHDAINPQLEGDFRRVRHVLRVSKYSLARRWIVNAKCLAGDV